jgi:hypothetical protein
MTSLSVLMVPTENPTMLRLLFIGGQLQTEQVITDRDCAASPANCPVNLTYVLHRIDEVVRSVIPVQGHSYDVIFGHPVDLDDLSFRRRLSQHLTESDHLPDMAFWVGDVTRFSPAVSTYHVRERLNAPVPA